MRDARCDALRENKCGPPPLRGWSGGDGFPCVGVEQEKFESRMEGTKINFPLFVVKMCSSFLFVVNLK